MATTLQGYNVDFMLAIASREDVLGSKKGIFGSNSSAIRKVKSNFKKRKIRDLLYYSPGLHERMFEIPPYAKNILKKPAKISTDKKPIELSSFVNRILPKNIITYTKRL